MALEGNLTYTSVTNHPTETEMQKREYPNGETEEFEVPKQVYKTETFEYIYVYVKQIEIFTWSEDGKKTTHIGYHYAGYKDKETKDNDIEDFLFFQTGMLAPFDYDKNLWSQCYDNIKERENFKDLVNC